MPRVDKGLPPQRCVWVDGLGGHGPGRPPARRDAHPYDACRSRGGLSATVHGTALPEQSPTGGTRGAAAVDGDRRALSRRAATAYSELALHRRALFRGVGAGLSVAPWRRADRGAYRQVTNAGVEVLDKDRELNIDVVRHGILCVGSSRHWVGRSMCASRGLQNGGWALASAEARGAVVSASSWGAPLVARRSQRDPWRCVSTSRLICRFRNGDRDLRDDLGWG